MDYFLDGPRQTILTAEEGRVRNRGTELEKHKIRISFVMCVNADGTHDFNSQAELLQ